MKKEYIEPQVTDIKDVDTELLAGSLTGSVTGSSEDGNVGLDYGGVDTGGNKDPEAKPCIIFDPWEEWKPNLIYDIWND